MSFDEYYAYIYRPDAVEVWKNEVVKERLSWYYQVMRNEKPAKYLISKRVSIPSDISLSDLDLNSLWELHREARKEFDSIRNEIINGAKIEDYPKAKQSFLDLKVEIVNRMLKKCNFCERNCGVDRTAGKRGVCGLNKETRVASAFMHIGEEAPLVPSGTIFFSGCSFKCVFCQNWDISQDPFSGATVTPKQLALIAIDLRKRGARNINYVGGNPDQQLHTIVESLKYMDINVPLLWNSNFYFTMDTLEILIDLIDIWLPDFKYGNNECARRYSLVDRYFDIVSRNHKVIHDRGEEMIIRHLVLPGHLECCTKPVLRWIAENTPRAIVNVMDQYRPEYKVLKEPDKYPEIARRLHRSEIYEAYMEAERLGLIYKPVS